VFPDVYLGLTVSQNLVKFVTRHPSPVTRHPSLRHKDLER